VIRHIIAARPFRGQRLRARRVDEASFCELVSARARKTEDWVFDAINGGGVTPSYKAPTQTECVLAVSDPLGIVVYWTARMDASLARRRGRSRFHSAIACWNTYRSEIASADLSRPLPAPLLTSILPSFFDEPTADTETNANTRLALIEEHQRLVPAMMTIAIAASDESLTS
jgi:hypothetical protein